MRTVALLSAALLLAGCGVKPPPQEPIDPSLKTATVEVKGMT